MADKSIGPGSVLAGRFQLEDLLQESSGAKFWRATDQTLARSVAVHVIAATDPRAEALLAAARESATVTDGHFLRVLDAAEENGVAYVVNEWAAGSSLDLMLTDGPLPSRRAAWLVMEASEAISIAHRHGVAHGRLIPENVMVTESGAVKLIGLVIDSVLSKEASPAHGDNHDEDQARDRASDVANLGSLLYAALVGRWPGSEGSSLPDAPRAHGRPLRPRRVRAGVPRPLDAICERVLNSDAHSQAMPIGTAHEICAALSDFIGDPASLVQSGNEPTTVISRDDIAPYSIETAPDQATRTDAAADAETGGPPWSAAGALGGRAPAVDPEATQAGAPVFFEEDTGVGWVDPGEPGAETGAAPGSSKRLSQGSPPPPFPPEPAPKPLFAPEPPEGSRARTPAATRDGAGTASSGVVPGPGTGYGTGSLPAVWGPDADNPEPGGDPGQWQSDNAGRSWLTLAGIIAACLLLVLAVILAFNLGRGSGEREPSAGQQGSLGASGPGTPTAPLTISAVSDFDPEGDPPEENPDLAGLAVDGDPTTAWQTMTYFNNPRLGLLKDGVGLVVDLGEPTDVSQVQLTLIGRPTSLQLLAADEGAGIPTGTAGLQEVANAENAGPKVSLDLEEPVTTQFLVVWLTSLPPAEGGFVGQIAEIVARP